ncbi:uncharacterized protein ISCGN_027257 [Ixodes scapularis]
MWSVVAALLLAVALGTCTQPQELPFDDLMADICRKYDNGVERREGVICVGKRMDIDLENIVTGCLHSRYRIANVPASELFDMLCDDDSRTMDRVYDCVDDQADNQGDRDWSLDEVTKFMQLC